MNKVMKEPSFLEVYKLPLSIDSNSIYIISDNNITTFSILTSNIDKVKKIIEVINRESNKKYNNVLYKDEVIYVDDDPIFIIKGWGYLTGIGGLNLPFEKAIEIQDSFCNWVVNRLKGLNYDN